MDIPQVRLDEIIKIGDSFLGPKAQIIHIYSDEDKKHGICGDVEVVYHQNGIKGVREDAIWNGVSWEFKNSGLGGGYVDINRYPGVKER